MNDMGVPLFRALQQESSSKIMYGTIELSDVYHYVILSGNNGKRDLVACNNTALAETRNGSYILSAHWGHPPFYMLSEIRPTNKRPCVRCLLAIQKKEDAVSDDPKIPKDLILTSADYREENRRVIRSPNKFHRCFLTISLRHGINKRELMQQTGFTTDKVDGAIEFLLDLGAIVCMRKNKRGLVFYASEEIDIVLGLLEDIHGSDT